MSLTAGISLSAPKRLKTEWTTYFNWTKEQEQMKTYEHIKTFTSITDLQTFTISSLYHVIGSQRVHFIHDISPDPNAIPLILLYGWPDSFLQMTQLVDGQEQHNPNTFTSLSPHSRA
ncbi:hypothetical protein CCMA1212_006538 [Trichoderma ghanense]|uniref:Epoxide hydrolase N-terminal domain-containing protein n=1 Tax=Trichoderma ghanense TaxID=65468 RepID=A0ABY2H102_9HYPO